MRRMAIAGAALVAVSASLGFQAPTLASNLGSVVPAGSPHSTLLPAQLAFLSVPTVAFGLLLLALLGIGLELVHPGALVPGIVGVLSGVLAVAGLLGLPINVVGLLLLGVAAALFVVDLVAPTHGVLSVAGMGAAIAGGVLMFRGDPVNPVALLGLPVAMGAIWVVLSRRALAVRRRPYPQQPLELLGQIGVVRESEGAHGLALVDGELWKVESRHSFPLPVGSEVEVMAQDGLTLIVDALGLPAGAGIKSALAEGDGAPAEGTVGGKS